MCADKAQKTACSLEELSNRIQQWVTVWTSVKKLNMLLGFGLPGWSTLKKKKLYLLHAPYIYVIVVNCPQIHVRPRLINDLSKIMPPGMAKPGKDPSLLILYILPFLCTYFLGPPFGPTIFPHMRRHALSYFHLVYPPLVIQHWHAPLQRDRYMVCYCHRVEARCIAYYQMAPNFL